MTASDNVHDNVICRKCILAGIKPLSRKPVSCSRRPATWVSEISEYGAPDTATVLLESTLNVAFGKPNAAATCDGTTEQSK